MAPLCTRQGVAVSRLLAGYSCYCAAVSDNYHSVYLLQCACSIRGKGRRFVVEIDARDLTDNPSVKRAADDDLTTDLEPADPSSSIHSSANPDPTPSSALII